MPDLPLTYEFSDGWIRRGVTVDVAADSMTLRVPGLSPGAVASVETVTGRREFAEVRAVHGSLARCVPLGRVDGIPAGSAASSSEARLGAFVGMNLLGAVTDAWGRSEDRAPGRVVSARPATLDLRERDSVGQMLRTGVFAIDAMLSLGCGQRIALTAGSGAGKSTLLRSIVKHADVDARVIALIGERARDAVETIDKLRDSPTWTSTTVVLAAADAAPIERFWAARTATAQAEWLCSTGRRVLLAMDSLTRVAAAWRELSLIAGEPPAHRGYPPSMIGALASLVERAGPRRCGSITAVYAILVDGDDPFEPVTDAVRGLLDGHILLSRRLCDAGRFPAIDVLRSLSRTMPDVASEDHLAAASLVRRMLATLEEYEDLFAIGAYRPGADAWLDACVGTRSALQSALYDDRGTSVPAECRLAEIA